MDNKPTDRILAFDPGLNDLGYAIVVGDQLVSSGVVPLRLLSRKLKFVRIREALQALLRAYEPTTLVLENIPRRPLDAMGGLPLLARLLHRMAANAHLRVASYSARAVRGSVVGDGWASKREVAEAMSTRFPDLRVYLTQDRKWKERYWHNMFDAVALALHHQAISKPPSRSRYSG